MSKIKKIIVFICLLSFPVLVNAQDRQSLRELIAEIGECRNVAITETSANLLLYGTNGWMSQHCPKELNAAMHKLHDEGVFIDDVQLTNEGRWLILYGQNGFRWSDGIPSSLEDKIRAYNDNCKIVTSVTFNDSGHWIVISDDKYSASDGRILEWLAEGTEHKGRLWTACMTENAIVAVYEYGYKFWGDIPETLLKGLEDADFDVYRLKIAGDAWFISDGESNFNFYM